MSKHTPGPWKWTGQDYPNFPVLRGVDGAEICNFGDDEQYYPTAGEPPRKEDALLIAAAPELLHLLIESQENIGGDWRERRDAIIQKATGAA